MYLPLSFLSHQYLNYFDDIYLLILLAHPEQSFDLFSINIFLGYHCLAFPFFSSTIFSSKLFCVNPRTFLGISILFFNPYFIYIYIYIHYIYNYIHYTYEYIYIYIHYIYNYIHYTYVYIYIYKTIVSVIL